MQLVYREFLDHITYRRNEILGLTGQNDCLYDAGVVMLLVGRGWSLMQKLLDDVGEFTRQALAHL